MNEQAVELSDVTRLTAEIVAAYVSNNQIDPAAVPALIHAVRGALTGSGGAVELPAGEAASTAPERPSEPAVPIDESVKPDQVFCLECGKGFRALKRHLATAHGLTPAEYKARWGLSKDYPLTAPEYSAARAETARRIGLGQKGRAARGKKAAAES
ncbi:MAG: MucR family transcriptional regulator [Alphaproteobacteria bacterium]|nr:MAG: MucR family transcriptional regulator [Alphaproteobacteria bacterium]